MILSKTLSHTKSIINSVCYVCISLIVQSPAKIMAVRIPLLILVITSSLSPLDYYLLCQIGQWNVHLKSNKKKVMLNIVITFILLSEMTSIIIISIYKAVNFFLKKKFRKFLIELEFFCISVSNTSFSYKKMPNF